MKIVRYSMVLLVLLVLAVTSFAEEIKNKRIIFLDNNIRLGASGNDTMTGNHNFFSGDQAGSANTTGTLLIGIGRFALRNNTTGNYSICIGDNACAANQTGSHNIGIGYQALQAATGTENIGVGQVALKATTTGTMNAAFGNDSLALNTTGGNNAALGQFSLFSNTTGSGNTVAGHSAGFFNTTGDNNTFMGKDAWATTTGNYNSFFGFAGGGANTTGSYNSSFGAYSGSEPGFVNIQRSTAIGYFATVACDDCMTLGPDAESANGGSPLKIGIGIMSPRLALDVSGDGNFTGDVGIGGGKTGAHGLIPGSRLSVDGNINITDNNSLRFGNANIYWKHDADTGLFEYQNFGGHQWNTYDNGYVSKMTLDNNGLTVVSLAGSGSRAVNANANGLLSAASDERMKENFVRLTDEKDVLSLLKKDIHAVYYNWKDKKKGERRELGMTAQMWENEIPEITGTEGDGHKYLDYQKIAVILWEQNKLLLQRIEALESGRK